MSEGVSHELPPEESWWRPAQRREIALVGVAAAAGISALALAARASRARKQRRSPLRSDLWNSSIDLDGRITGIQRVLDKARQRGVEPALKPSLWPFLLQLYSASSTASERVQKRSVLETHLRQLLRRCEKLDVDLRRLGGSDQGAVLAAAGAKGEYASSRSTCMQFEEAQRVIVLDVVRMDMAAMERAEKQIRGGEVVSAGDGGTSAESRNICVWTGRMAEEALRDAPHLNAYARHTARRLISLLSAYAVYDPEIGYCQGMSDLAAPFVAVLADDVEAFWCFESLMQTARRDFGDGGEGMGMRLRTLARTLEHHDPVLVHKLYLSGAADCLFAYRMVLVRMRRELSLDKCLLLWEVIWAEELAGSLGFGPRWRMLLKDHATTIAEFNLSALERERRTVPDLLTCFIADVIRCQRRPLLASVRETDDVARVFSAYDIDLWKSLNEARRLQTAMAGKIAVLKQASKKS
mmetsp:Transcript_11085/g.26301  ORF Transcript_11085/g.26301 Transcript_11085/m.26301 type:complete len:467 (+) Transcript_11085:110-1510(+)